MRLEQTNSSRLRYFAGGKAIRLRPNGVPTGRPRSASLRASSAVIFDGSGNRVPLSLGGEGRGEGARTLNGRSNVRDERKTHPVFQGSELNRGHKDFQSSALLLNIEYSTLNISVPAPNPNGVPSLSPRSVASQVPDYQVESNPVKPSQTNCLQLQNCSTARQSKASQTQSNLVKVNQGKSGKRILSAVFNYQRSMTVSSTLSVECFRKYHFIPPASADRELIRSNKPKDTTNTPIQ